MTYHIFVSGRVQGVGYRRFAQKHAQNLSLNGWTRNLMDGRVEIEVSGPEKALDEYCEILKQGPTFSQVRDVMIKNLNQEVESRGFEIRPDPEMK